MPKSDLEKQLDKFKRSMEKQSKDQMRVAKRQAAKERTNSISTNIIANFQTIAGFTVMNAEAEQLLQGILDQYDGNENLFVNFDSEKLDPALIAAVPQYLDVLEQMGLLARRFSVDNGDFFNLTYSGRDYFKNKAEAEERAQAEKERKEKLEGDIVKIQNMNVDQLRDIYIQAVMANASLKESLDVEQKQLEILKNLFASGEEGAADQKEIMKQLIDTENGEHPIRDYIADKGGDIGVAALTASAPAIFAAIKAWLASMGVML